MNVTNSYWLILAGIFAVIALFVGKNLLRRLAARKLLHQRSQVEDALKVIFNLEHEGQTVDQYRLADALKTNSVAIQALISDLRAQQLIQGDQSISLNLTPKGERWALQVIRAHRLWESYLADEVRMPLKKVHTIAHHHEHRMSLEQINALDAALGHPARDPHGDPIPNEAGKLRNDRSSVPLLNMTPGQHGQISHLEDEPPLAYAQLLAEGLFVGQSILVQENNLDRVLISDTEGEYTLAPSIASNVSVIPELAREHPTPGVIPLSRLESNAQAEIVHIDNRCQGFTRRRLLDLGLTPGTPIFLELENIFHDPRAYRVRGTLIALRGDQANMIWVKPMVNGESS